MTSVTQIGSPYEHLYASRAGPLWNAPGRLIRRISEWLPPGTTVWDAGCGDGKNALFLAQLGYHVSGIDLSPTAIDRLHQRFSLAEQGSTAFSSGDACVVAPAKASVDCLVSYGLYHCLERAERIEDHQRLHEVVRPGGYILFSALTDALALPETHRTPGIRLATRAELDELFSREEVLEVISGVIREHHRPLVGYHRHSVTWIVARRPA